MRWIVVLVVSAAFLADVSWCDDQYESLQRLKRSPHYDCPPYYPPPPPPPPPFWRHHRPHFWPPPPSPPYWQQNQQNLAYSAANAEAAAQANQAQSQAASTSQVQPAQPPASQPQPASSFQPLEKNNGEGTPPCSTCEQNSAISNAESNSGSAVAVAIARVKSN